MVAVVGWVRLYGILTNRWLLAAVVAVPLVAGVLTPKMSFDEAIWTHIGAGWVAEGDKPYLERFDNKPPGILLVFGLAHLAVGVNTWMVRMIGVLALVLAAMAVYAIGRTVFDRTAGALAMMFFGMMMPRDIVDGPYAAHTESFTVLFSALAFYFLTSALRAAQTRTYILKFLLAWLSVGVAAFCFKQIAICTAIGLLAFHFLHRKSAGVRTSLARDLPVAAGGLAASVFLALCPLILSGVPMMEYWRAVWVSLFQAGAANMSASERVWGFFRTWRHSEFLFFLPLLAVFLTQRRRLKAAGVPLAGITAWLIADFLGANASGNYYGHQLKQVVPPLALASGLGLGAVLRAIDTKVDRVCKWALTTVASALLLLMPYGTLLTGLFQKPQKDLDRELGTWIRSNSTAADAVLTCGPTSMQILAWSQRKTPCRYFNPMFVALPGAEAEFDKALDNSPPRYLVIPEEGLDALLPRERTIADRLAGMIAGSYTPKLVKDGYRVYERRRKP